MRASAHFALSASMCSCIIFRVLRREDLGHDRHFLTALEILEARRAVVGKVDLRRVEHVKDHEIVAEKSVRLQGLEERLWVLVTDGRSAR